MSINRYNPRRDKNEPEIFDYLTSRGLSVVRLNTPLDLLVGYNNKNYLVEVKMPKKGLNKNQVEFVQKWKGQYFVCYTVNQAQLFADAILNN